MIIDINRSRTQQKEKDKRTTNQIYSNSYIRKPPTAFKDNIILSFSIKKRLILFSTHREVDVKVGGLQHQSLPKKTNKQNKAKANKHTKYPRNQTAKLAFNGRAHKLRIDAPVCLLLLFRGNFLFNLDYKRSKLKLRNRFRPLESHSLESNSLESHSSSFSRLHSQKRSRSSPKAPYRFVANRNLLLLL